MKKHNYVDYGQPDEINVGVNGGMGSDLDSAYGVGVGVYIYIGNDMHVYDISVEECEQLVKSLSRIVSRAKETSE